MFAVLPGSWKCDLPEDISVHFRTDGEEALDFVRSALASGSKLFLIGVDGVSSRNKWIVASDHIALFGGSPLIGSNREDLGPRFPSLMDLYITPDGSWEKGVIGRVPEWRLATPAEFSMMGADALVSEGVDEAEVAGHGGARVIFLVRCHSWDSFNTEVSPVREAAEAALDLFNSKFTGGGEEQ
ncbi:MAG: hypothetical protein KAW14_06450 [Candidatus Aegiribacteria sp.]|nr:hypothetical protein [Candidatus Aegiribacteria sp.]